MRPIPGYPAGCSGWERGAASHPGSGSRREIQKMLRIYFGDRAVLGLHPWAFGLPAATVLSPASPAAVFSIHRVIRYYKLRPLLWCWRIPFFQRSSRVLQDEGLPAPFFWMFRLLLLRRQVRSRAGMRHGPSFFDPEPSFESTF